MKIILTLIQVLICSCLMQAQEQKFISPDEAVEWIPQLIGYNIEIIGEQNEKGISKDVKERVEYLFITDTKIKAEKLKVEIQNKYGYNNYREYFIEDLWIVSGITDEILMEFDNFSKWTFDFSKLGFASDAKLLTWNFFNQKKADTVDAFWKWFELNHDEYYNMDSDNMKSLESSFDKLSIALAPINPDLVFEFSPILDSGKREFILSADGMRTAFTDLLDLYKRAPILEKWIIIPFKQAHDYEPSLEFSNGYKLGWDKVMFDYKVLEEGLDINFYIKDYDENNPNFGTALMVLLDSYLGEYVAVTKIRHVALHKLKSSKSKEYKKFTELKEVIDSM